MSSHAVRAAFYLLIFVLFKNLSFIPLRGGAPRVLKSAGVTTRPFSSVDPTLLVFRGEVDARRGGIIKGLYDKRMVTLSGGHTVQHSEAAS